ncbi:MAG: ribose-phosphate diphosphokinase [Methanomicrobiaceae archaeon]|uniref:ribose-phosphate diphosphokinase n=1 Tax=hydrocarbon metagenome TaxID=938273 RepID=A0A0W8FHV1_9ZZZZ|nr:ribose-phosphate diphosphokinase [Methanomicrobiaceae archaeon]MDD5418330.1 ribose-phosphate diphosphokinase [Methanomicrobiaceae archaeon]
MRSTKVISTEKSQVLATRVAEELRVPVVDTRFSRFPDGELYLRAGELDDEMVIVSSVVDNDALVQLLLLIDACDGSSNTLVIPYLAYARQDKRFNPGEPISIRAVARALSHGVREIFVVNIHQPDALRYFRVTAANISIAPAVGRYIQSLEVSNPLILAPDEGAIAFAGDVAAVGGWDCDFLEKNRISSDEIRINPKSLNVSSRDVVLVDDIISTGGTLATAAGMLYRQGAATVHAACVHGVLSTGAYARLRSVGIATVASSDTYERACSCIPAAGEIARAIRPC